MKKSFNKKEKNANINNRMLAVRMVLAKGKNYEEVAEIFSKCTKWVQKWVNRFREGGFDALREPSTCRKAARHVTRRDRSDNSRHPRTS